ncbi:hypothetical protein D3C80_1986960 [compost metagenome]
MQSLVLREEVDLKATETSPGFQVPWVAVAVARHRVVTDHQAIGFTRNEPAFNGDTIHCREENLLVLHAVFVRPPQNRSTRRVRHQIGETIDKIV